MYLNLVGFLAFDVIVGKRMFHKLNMSRKINAIIQTEILSIR